MTIYKYTYRTVEKNKVVKKMAIITQSEAITLLRYGNYAIWGFIPNDIENEIIIYKKVNQ